MVHCYDSLPRVGENICSLLLSWVYNRPVHILTLLILIWLRSVFEAHFHTDPKTKKKFCLVERFPCYRMISDPHF